MKMLLVGLLIFLLPYLSFSTEINDPFVNPLKELSFKKEKALNRKGKDEKIHLNLYVPVIDKSFGELRIEGIIGVDSKKFLVLKDPEMEKVYMLKEGDAVSPDTKIEKISYDEVILAKYYKEGKELKRQIIRLKVEKEE